MSLKQRFRVPKESRARTAGDGSEEKRSVTGRGKAGTLAGKTQRATEHARAPREDAHRAIGPRVRYSCPPRRPIVRCSFGPRHPSVRHWGREPGRGVRVSVYHPTPEAEGPIGADPGTPGSALGVLAAQHYELLQVGLDLASRINPQLLAEGARRTRSVLAALTLKLRNHRATEERILYPVLLGHADPTVRMTARQFQQDMDHFTEQVLGYVNVWSSAPAIQACAVQFITETSRILGALGTRLDLEDRELLPLLHR